MDIISFITYLRVERNYSQHTLQAYTNDLQQAFAFLKDTYGVEHAEDVKHQFLRSWVVQMMTDELNPTSIHRKVSALKSYYKFLLKKGQIRQNPASSLILPKKGRRIPAFVDQQFLAPLDLTACDFAVFRQQVIVEVFYQTGMRLSELIGMRVNDVDFYNLSIRVTGKRNKERSIPITPGLADMLKRYLHHPDRKLSYPADWFFTTDGGKKLYPKFVYLLVKSYLSLAEGLEKKSPHVLRHTFATHMLENGADLNTIKTILGHSSLAATQVYTHNTIGRLKEVLKSAHPRG